MRSFALEMGARQSNERLRTAVRDGNLERVKELVQGGADISQIESERPSLLEEAAVMGHLDIVQFLVDKGANDDKTLLYAAGHGNLGVVCYLVEQGFDKEAKDSIDQTALIRAAYQGHLDVVRYLVEEGAEKEAKGSDRRYGFRLDER